MKKINIDYLRLIASFMIVAIHTYPLSFINDSVDYIFTRILFRVAVPFFLMITGYFVLKKDREYLIKYTKKISILYFLSIIIYLPINIYNAYFTNFSLISFMKDIFLTGTIYHLWYFPATIIALWLCYFLLTKLSLKKVFLIASILYLIGLLGDSYYHLISNIGIIKIIYQGILAIIDYTRNFFLAPIFLILGYSIKEKKLNIPKENKLIIIFVITLLLEGIISFKFNLYLHNSMYISLIPLMYLLFSKIITSCRTNKKVRTYGTVIYIMHPFFIALTHFASRYLLFLKNSLINYLVVSLLSFFLAYLVDIFIVKTKVYNKSKIMSN